MKTLVTPLGPIFKDYRDKCGTDPEEKPRLLSDVFKYGAKVQLCGLERFPWYLCKRPDGPMLIRPDVFTHNISLRDFTREAIIDGFNSHDINWSLKNAIINDKPLLPTEPPEPKWVPLKIEIVIEAPDEAVAAARVFYANSTEANMIKSNLSAGSTRFSFCQETDITSQICDHARGCGFDLTNPQS